MQWFIAVINGGHATTLELPLDFLGVGSSRSTELRDSKDKPDAWIAERINDTQGTHPPRSYS